MRAIKSWLRFDPVVIVTLTLLTATILVIYLQRGAFAALEQQSVLVREKILDQTAREIALDIRTAIEEPAYDTVRALTRAELLADGLRRVLPVYEQAIHKYPQIDRLFVWSDDTEARVPGEVLFFNGVETRVRSTPEEQLDKSSPRPPPSVPPEVWKAFWRDHELGALIYQGVRTASVAHRNYTALRYPVGDCTYDVLAHYYWLEPERSKYFFLIGYVVCAEKGGKRLLQTLYGGDRVAWLNRGDRGDKLALDIFDEQHRLMFGSARRPSGISGRVAFPSQFYPTRTSSLTVTAPSREWTVQVSSGSPEPTALRIQGVWLLGLSVLLILVALGVAVRGQKRASELARMQAEFVSHVSHQLRTPLSLLSGVTETIALDRVKSPEKSAAYLEIVHKETRRLSTLVERILEFSRVGGGRTYHFEPVDLRTLVRETTEAFAEKPPADTFRIVVEDDGSAGVINADPVALEQALVNLLDNAVKYSESAHDVVVRVRGTPHEAIVEVEDRGVGIARAEQARIFERFYRASGASRQRGFGLGLAIVKEIIDAHRGRIDVESAPGRGTLIRLRLPMHNPAWRFWRLVATRLGRTPAARDC